MAQFRVVQELPKGINTGEVERVVREFVNDAHIPEQEKEGLYQQTLEGIAQCLFFKMDGQQFWLAEQEGEILAYVRTHVAKDVDNQLCYWVTQAWVSPKVRGRRIVKEWFQDLRNEAKRLMCRHIIIPSSRSTKAYLRFLGKKWHVYVTLLKEDI